MPMDTDTNVIALRPRQSAPVQVHPRAHFGVRAGMEAAREADARAAMQRAVTPTERASMGDRSHICPTLDASLATKWEVLAEMAEKLACETKALGWLKQAVTAREIASICETVSAEVSR